MVLTDRAGNPLDLDAQLAMATLTVDTLDAIADETELTVDQKAMGGLALVLEAALTELKRLRVANGGYSNPIDWGD